MHALAELRDVCMVEQDWEAAERAYRSALEEMTRVTTRSLLANAGRRYAALCQARGDHARAVRLLTAYASISRAWDSTVDFDPIANEERILEAARTALGEPEFARVVAAGQSFTLEEAIADPLRLATVC